MFEQVRMRTLVLPITLILFVGLAAVVILSSSLTTFGGMSLVPSGSVEVEKEAAPQRYATNWDDNPVAYIPEANGFSHSNGYQHNWDDNPVAYIPEAEGFSRSNGYQHNWDDNPVAYIPEAKGISHSNGYQPNWDDNPVAYIPEAEVIEQP